MHFVLAFWIIVVGGDHVYHNLPHYDAAVPEQCLTFENRTVHNREFCDDWQAAHLVRVGNREHVS